MTKKVNEISLGDYRKKATMQKAQSQMGAMFARDPAEREKNLATFNKREKGVNRLKARDQKAKADSQAAQTADLVARLPELKAEYEKMKAEYKSLGGSNWQYADREQNLTDYERKARGMEGPMNNLWRQIQAAEKAQGGVAEGLGKDIKRAAQGWGGAQDKPADIVKRNKGYDTDTAKKVRAHLDNAPDHTPAGLQKRVLDRKLKGVAEGSDGEYNDEAGMVDNNLETMKRAVAGLDSVIHTGDNLPEWCQEKIAVAKSMLVAVWDYMESEEQSVAEGDVKEWKKGVKAPVKPRNFVAKNATTGGAGAHKDKKKAQKQGQTKHKKKPELAESTTYDRRLNALLETKILIEQFKQFKK